jgi:uncharacterized membrane protein YfcA
MTDQQFWFLIAATTFTTSIVSGVLGMAGGMLLLSILLVRLDPVIAVPIHGCVQLVSNGSRAWILRKEVKWRAVLRFAWPLLPAGLLGMLCLKWTPAAWGRILIGAFVLAATWLKPVRPKQATSDSALQGRRLLPLGGAVVGFFSTLVGATGPLLGPFILALDLGPRATIGTMAACQIFQHGSKVLLFGLGDFDFGAYAGWIALLASLAVVGTKVGTRFLDRLKPTPFKIAVRVVLSLLSLQLLYSGFSQLGARG